MSWVPGPALVTFTVPGLPIGQAELSVGKTGKAYYRNAADLKPWRETITAHAKVAKRRRRLELIGKQLPVYLHVLFVLPRPPSVKRPLPSVRPDLQHYVRSAEDALTKHLYADDGQITDTTSAKRYVDATHPRPCVVITLGPMIEET